LNQSTAPLLDGQAGSQTTYTVEILLDQSVYRCGNRIRDGLLFPIFEHVGKLSSVE
jgi:hypothetical protein